MSKCIRSYSGICCSIVVLFALLLCFSSAVYADVGLDPNFGDGGLVTNNSVTGINCAWSIGIDSQERIIVAGDVNDNLSVVRFDTSGSPDSSFSGDGIVQTSITGVNVDVRSCVIDSDDRIYLAGSFQDGSSVDFALVRYLENGDLDPDFGNSGIVSTDILSSDIGESCAIDRSTGRVIVAGQTSDLTYGYFAVACYEASGDLDTEFGTDGIVTTHFGKKQDHAYSCAIDSKGRIVVAGIATNESFGSDFGVARFLASGDLDESFDNDGLVITDLTGTADRSQSCVVDSNDRVLVAGRVANPDQDFALARYLQNGDLDTSFGNGGVVITDFAGEWDDAYSVVIDHEGRILVAGYANLPEEGINCDFALARYLQDGSPDPSFGNQGKITTDLLNNSVDFGRACAIDSSGRIMLAGNVGPGDHTYNLALARYIEVETDDPPSDGGGCSTGILPFTAGLLLLPILLLSKKIK